MFRLYIDDSGKEDQSPVQVLAGYLATERQWINFTGEWRSILQEAKIDEFKMADAWRMSKSWHSAGPLNRNIKIIKLLECIQRNIAAAFVSSYSFSAFYDSIDPYKDHSKMLGRPYYYNFYSLLTQFYNWKFKYLYNEEVDIIFDIQGGESERFILEGLREFKRLASVQFLDHKVNDPKFCDSRETVPLQAADLLAWLVRRDAVNLQRKRNRSDCADNFLLKIALSMPHSIQVWNHKKLALVAQGMANYLLKNHPELNH